jgi:hypothetical protein
VRLSQTDGFPVSFHDLQFGTNGVSLSMMSLKFFGAVEFPVLVEVAGGDRKTFREVYTLAVLQTEMSIIEIEKGYDWGTRLHSHSEDYLKPHIFNLLHAFTSKISSLPAIAFFYDH